MRGVVAATTVLTVLAATAAMAAEFAAMPGLWKTTYEIRGAVGGAGAQPGPPKVVFHCVDETADPWESFAQLQDLPGMSCSRTSLQRTSTSLKWHTECHGPGPAELADVMASEGAVIFTSAQHYTGRVRFTGKLMGYPVESASDFEGSRIAACTSPLD